MKIMVVSDTHGSIEQVLEQYHKLNEVDLVIHLGDSCRDAERINDMVDSEVIYIKGNIDSEPSEESHKIIQMLGHKMLLTHGHTEKVKSGLLQLYYKALSLSCEIVLFGHTHIPVYQQEGNVLLINPGSLVKPKGGNLPSFALLTIKEYTASAEIIFPEIS